MSKKFDDIDTSDLPEELKAIIKALDDMLDNIDGKECDCPACRASKEHGEEHGEIL